MTMTALMPAGFTTEDLRQCVLHRPINIASTLGLHVTENTSIGYIQETFRQLNEKYGFEFEIPFQAKKLEDSPAKVQEMKKQVKQVQTSYPSLQHCGIEVSQSSEGFPIKIGV